LDKYSIAYFSDLEENTSYDFFVVGSTLTPKDYMNDGAATGV